MHVFISARRSTSLRVVYRHLSSSMQIRVTRSIEIALSSTPPVVCTATSDANTDRSTISHSIPARLLLRVIHVCTTDGACLAHILMYRQQVRDYNYCYHTPSKSMFHLLSNSGALP